MPIENIIYRWITYISNHFNFSLTQVWLISCTLFVFLALMEYFIVLFSIRYDKHWRTAKPKPAPPPPSSAQSASLPNASLSMAQNERKNGLEQAARAFSTMNKITPESRAKFSTMAAKRREEALINEANCIPPPNNPILGNRRRFVHVYSERQFTYRQSTRR